MQAFRLVYFILFLSAAVLSACVNDIEKIKKITFKAKDPEEKTSELYLTYTDSGMAKIRLYAPLAESFSKPEKVISFREGLKVEFYNSKGGLSSILTAQYGEINEADGTMEVRDSVRLFNPIKNQTLETEALFWTRKDSTIFTDKLVVVRTDKALIMGEGIRTKQDFSWYEFLKPRGKFNIDSKK